MTVEHDRPTRPPVAFISYSHDSNSHKAWVHELSERLRGAGARTVLDQYVGVPADDWNVWVESGLDSADIVVLVCSERYVEAWNTTERTGKYAIYETRLIRQLMVEARGRFERFVVVVRDGERDLQRPLGLRVLSTFQHASEFETLSAAVLARSNRDAESAVTDTRLNRVPLRLSAPVWRVIDNAASLVVGPRRVFDAEEDVSSADRSIRRARLMVIAALALAWLVFSATAHAALPPAVTWTISLAAGIALGAAEGRIRLSRRLLELDRARPAPAAGEPEGPQPPVAPERPRLLGMSRSALSVLVTAAASVTLGQLLTPRPEPTRPVLPPLPAADAGRPLDAVVADAPTSVLDGADGSLDRPAPRDGPRPDSLPPCCIVPLRDGGMDAADGAEVGLDVGRLDAAVGLDVSRFDAAVYVPRDLTPRMIALSNLGESGPSSILGHFLSTSDMYGEPVWHGDSMMGFRHLGTAPYAGPLVELSGPLGSSLRSFLLAMTGSCGVRSWAVGDLETADVRMLDGGWIGPERILDPYSSIGCCRGGTTVHSNCSGRLVALALRPVHLRLTAVVRPSPSEDQFGGPMGLARAAASADAGVDESWPCSGRRSGNLTVRGSTVRAELEADAWLVQAQRTEGFCAGFPARGR